MKNILNYYYGIIVDNIDNNGYFSYNNHLFCLYQYHRNIGEINSLVILNNYMITNGVHVNKIILNNLNQAITYFENKNYVLLLINYSYKDGFFNFVLAPINKNLTILNRNDWAYLWSVKVDYIEYQIRHIENNYPLLNESVNYYIGLSENAISYFKMLFLDKVPLFINHRRINKDDLYNPLELVIDYKVRDIGEYIKYTFFKKEKSVYDIKRLLNSINLNSIDYYLLYDRLLFPSYYFDVYERIINNDLNEDKIKVYIDMVSEYEELLYEIYVFLKRKINIMGIEWINVKYV